MMKGFILDLILEKLMIKFKKIFEKSHFWAILTISGQLIFFFKNPALSRTTSHWSLPAYQFLKKSNDMIPIKCMVRWMDRRTDGRTDRTDFIGPFGHRPVVQYLISLNTQNVSINILLLLKRKRN